MERMEGAQPAAGLEFIQLDQDHEDTFTAGQTEMVASVLQLISAQAFYGCMMSAESYSSPNIGQNPSDYVLIDSCFDKWPEMGITQMPRSIGVIPGPLPHRHPR